MKSRTHWIFKWFSLSLSLSLIVKFYFYCDFLFLPIYVRNKRSGLFSKSMMGWWISSHHLHAYFLISNLAIYFGSDRINWLVNSQNITKLVGNNSNRSGKMRIGWWKQSEILLDTRKIEWKSKQSANLICEMGFYRQERLSSRRWLISCVSSLCFLFFFFFYFLLMQSQFRVRW